jgi:glycosyltransferase involved in cell wall biosynthesis
VSAAPTAFSVVICTRNRQRLIERCIRSVFAQEYPKSCLELIVVDNGSTDETPAAIARCLSGAPVAISSFVEPRPGVSASRNAGARRARFEHVAFLDDDAAADPGWLAANDAVIREHHPPVVGGRVEPVIESGVTPPSWWAERDIRGLFGLDHQTALDGRRVAPIRWPLWLGGGNCVYTKQVLAGAGAFKTDLGPTGTRRRVAEDIDLNVRLERAAVPIYYAHDAVIHHLVTAERLAPRSICRRAYWAGRTDAAVRTVLTGRAKRLPVSSVFKAAIALPTAAEPTVSLCRLAYDMGYLVQSRGLVRHRGAA